MASRKQLHYYLRSLRHVKTWQLFAVALLLSAVSVVALRENSMQAVRLFEAVKQADRDGQGTTQALRQLQRYVSTHMNTQLERVSLEATYARDYQQALKESANSGGVNDANYAQAEAACQAELARSGSFPAYAQCVSTQVGQTAPGDNPELQESLPKPELYQFTFISPSWSPDIAGLSTLITGVIWLTILTKILVRAILSLLLRRQSQT